MSKHIAWSWSRLSDFEQCPRMFQGKYITKEFKGDYTAPHFKKGRAAHKLMEDHFKEGGPLKGHVNGFDFDFTFLEKFSDMVNRATQVLPELQVTFDVCMNEVAWFDKQNAANRKAWVRGAFDLLVIIGDFALVIDWKTGKIKKYSDQLKLFAGLVMTKYPHSQRVMTAYVWLEHPSVKPVWAEYTDKDREDIWQEFGDRAELIQMANESGNWPPKKNIFCGWCDATEAQCEFKT